MDRSTLGVIMIWIALALLLAVPVAAALTRGRRVFGRVGWAVTAATFAVVLVGLWFWVSPVVVDGSYCFLGSPAVDGLIPDRPVPAVDDAGPGDPRLACSSVAQRIVVGWGVVIAAALAGWAWFVGRLPRRVPGAQVGSADDGGAEGGADRPGDGHGQGTPDEQAGDRA